MKNLFLGLALIASTGSFAGKIDVKIGEISNQKISVDKKINIDEMTLKLNCHWKTTFLQDLGGETNSLETESINVSLDKVAGGYKVSTSGDLLLDEYRFKANKHCFVRFDMKVSSEKLKIYVNSYMTQIKLGTKGNLTSELLKALGSKRFTADTFVNQREENVLSRIVLK